MFQNLKFKSVSKLMSLNIFLVPLILGDSSSDADIDLNEFDCDEDIEGISHPGLVPDS